jgi:hypothetical protein
MTPEEMEARIKDLEKQVNILQATEDIKKLQRAYGYYLEHWMSDEIVDLFADGPGTGVEWPEGSFLGKEGLRRYFESRKKPNREFLHQVIPSSAIIDVDSNGKTAKGRWYGFGGLAVPRGKGVRQSFIAGIYENDYVKEDGKWKIQRIKWSLIFNAPPAVGWVKPERIAALNPSDPPDFPEPDVPPTGFEPQYPSGYVFPFHFKHPVTGKKTSEEKRNKALGIKE